MLKLVLTAVVTINMLLALAIGAAIVQGKALESYELAVAHQQRDRSEIFTMDVGRGLLVRIGRSLPAHYVGWSALPVTGRVAFISWRSGDNEVYVMDTASGVQENISSNPASDLDPVWSPDGKRLAFVSWRDNDSEIYVRDMQTGALANVSNHPERDYDPAWSLDGRRLAFVSRRDYNTDIYVLDLDGGAQINVSQHEAADLDPVWSPDGRRLAFVSYRDGNSEIYVADLDSGGMVNVSRNRYSDDLPSWSPDGAWLAYVSHRGLCESEINVVNIAQPARRARLDSDYLDPIWLSDGERMVFLSQDGGLKQMYRLDITSGRLDHLGELTSAEYVNTADYIFPQCSFAFVD